MPQYNNEKQIEPSKLHGTYPQKQDGFFMQRIPVFAGRITATQLREIAEITIEFTGNSPLHLTTRQGIEFHNIAEADTQKVLNRVNDIGFPTFGSGGDSVRNITVCPCCKFDKEAYDVEPLAEQVRQEVSMCGMLENLGRKFKITFAGCNDPQTRPFVNDISFIATSESRVCVVGAGSLGARPESGIVLFEEIQAKDAIPLTIAAIEMFSDHGDRENRRKARFRHIRQAMGNEAFTMMLGEYFGKWKAKFRTDEIILDKGLQGWKKTATIQTIGGDIDVKDTILLAGLVEQAGAYIRINGYHGIDIFTKGEFKLSGDFAKYTNLPRIIACPASTTCPKGIVNCPEAATLIAEQLRGNESFYDTTIALSGCPNNCACSAVADIGLVGRLKDKKPAFNITFNKGNGNNNSLGRKQGIVPLEENGQWITENHS